MHIDITDDGEPGSDTAKAARRPRYPLPAEPAASIRLPLPAWCALMRPAQGADPAVPDLQCAGQRMDEREAG